MGQHGTIVDAGAIARGRRVLRYRGVRIPCDVSQPRMDAVAVVALIPSPEARAIDARSHDITWGDHDTVSSALHALRVSPRRLDQNESLATLDDAALWLRREAGCQGDDPHDDDGAHPDSISRGRQ